jgi:glycosyltransferase involved in cell wall biosynthesis
MQRQVLLIAGMHRSGTSLLARLLNLHGVHLPLEMEYRDEFNERGYWESFAVQKLNDDILRLGDSSWFDPRPFSMARQSAEKIEEAKQQVQEFVDRVLTHDAELFAVKDPRICRIIPIWRSAVESCGAKALAVLPYRHPLEVAASINRRDLFSTKYCLSLWLRNVLEAEFATRKLDRVFCSYPDMLSDWPSAIGKISEQLQFSSLLPFSEVEGPVNDFMSESLKHWSFPDTDLETYVGSDGLAYQAFQLLRQIDQNDNARIQAEFDLVREEFGKTRSIPDELEYRNLKVAAFGGRITEALDIRDSEISSLGNELGTIKNRLIDRDSQLDSLGKELTVIKSQLGQREQRVDSLGKQLKATKGRLTRREQRVDSLGKQLKATKGRLTRRDQRIDSLGRELGETISSLTLRDRQNQELKSRLDRAGIRQKKRKARIKKLKVKLLEEKLLNEQIEERLANMMQSVSNLTKLLADSKKSEGRLISDLQESNAAFENQAGEHAELSRQYEFLEQAYTARKKELIQLNIHFQRVDEGYRAVLNSLSWKMTWPIRVILKYLVILPAMAIVSLFSKLIEFPKRLIRSIGKRAKQDELLSTELESRKYIPICTEPAPDSLPVKLIAFYLPQFHPIPENDEWWGEGFTEWTNVRSAKPQFSGHNQPRVPDELAYYDLRDIEVQKRQVELARLYGVGGFCFYFYWFNGKRLLETPLLQYLDSAEFDLPFCLCWANENWSRTWDGLDDHVLIGQEHSEADDLEFINYISKYFVDERYIRVNGRPLLIIYRPSLLPNPKETVTRWREWCKVSGIGEIFVAYTQSFDAVDPAVYGFDAAIEFPPNNTGPDIVTDRLTTADDFSGIIYDWTSVASRSRQYQDPDYCLFRAVNPSWDNTARRAGTGGIFVGSTPAAYEEWLRNAVKDTVQRFPSPSQRMVFVNAWNEWAEGAYLEPDKDYGYAYLQATRNALEDVAQARPDNKIILVAHDALPHGAQYLSMNIAKTLSSGFGFEVDMVVLGDGVLMSEYEKWARVHRLDGGDPGGEKAIRLANSLAAGGCSAAICNTTVSGLFLETLSKAGIRCVALIHELKNVIVDNRLQPNALAIARNADSVVFPATEVLEAFQEIAEVPEDKIVIRTQGLYKNNAYLGRNDQAKLELRKELGLPAKSRIVLGVGYLDHRKGVDLFVEAGLDVLKNSTDVYFVWVGYWEAAMETQIKDRLEDNELAHHFVFPGRKEDTDPYYAGADVFVLASREDPFPTTIMEALEVGVPVVGFSGAGGFENLLKEDCGILVPLEDVGSLSDAITALLDNPKTAKFLGDHGAELVRDRYSFRHYLYDLLELVQRQPMRVSAIVPNYNYAQYLLERLSSIFSQTYPIYEVIVLDDASTDNSVEVIEKCLAHTDIDCRLIVNRKNSGSVSKQWQKAVESAKGDFIWICEADDVAKPDFLKKTLVKFSDPEVVLSYSQSMQIDEEGNSISDDYLEYTNDISGDRWRQDYVCDGIAELSEALSVKNTIPNVSAVVFRKSALSVSMDSCGPILRKLKVAGDWLIYSDLLLNGKIGFCSEPLNAHRRHRNSVTIDAANNARHMAEILFMQKRIAGSVDISADTRRKCKGFEQHALSHLNISDLKGGKTGPGEGVSFWLSQLNDQVK